MGIDGQLKRFFPFVVCLLLGTAAYLQAVGIGRLVGAAAIDGRLLPAPRTGAPRGARAGEALHATSAAAILARNPFSSVTGSLQGEAPDFDGLRRAELVAGADPYLDPTCPGARVRFLVASDDPDWSFAAVAGPDGKVALRRRGDALEGQRVDFIGDRRPPDARAHDGTSRRDRVWLTSASGRCQVSADDRGPLEPAAAATARKARLAGAPDFSSRIHRHGPTEVEVDRSVVDQVLESPGDLMRTVRVVPEKEGDRVVGLRLAGIPKGSLLGTLGLENGDRLRSVNGFEMSDPGRALEAYARLRTADHLTVAVDRGGKPMTLDLTINP